MGGGSKSCKKFLSSQLKHYIYIHTESCAYVCVFAFNHNGSNNKPIKTKKIISVDKKINFGGWNEFQEMQVLDSLDYKYLLP